MESLQRILIVEGYALLIAGLRTLLAEDADIEVLDQTLPGNAGIAADGGLRPHLLLLDTSVPGVNARDMLAQARRRHPGARVLIVMREQSEDFVLAMLQAGADGCVRNNAAGEDLRLAVRSVLQGRSYLDANIFGDALAAAPYEPISGRGGAADNLTPRERDVLRLVAAGKTSKDIAEALGLSVKTVGKHRANMMAKLDLHNAASLTLYAIERGLLKK